MWRPGLQAQRDAIELFDEVAASPELCMRGRLEAGDIQLLNNHTCLHARDAFTDHFEVQLQQALEYEDFFFGSRVGRAPRKIRLCNIWAYVIRWHNIT